MPLSYYINYYFIKEPQHIVLEEKRSILLGKRDQTQICVKRVNVYTSFEDSIGITSKQIYSNRGKCIFTVSVVKSSS